MSTSILYMPRWLVDRYPTQLIILRQDKEREYVRQGKPEQGICFGCGAGKAFVSGMAGPIDENDLSFLLIKMAVLRCLGLNKSRACGYFSVVGATGMGKCGGMSLLQA